MDKTHLAIIIEFSDLRYLFKILDRKYFTLNAACLCYLLHNCQTVSIPKNVGVIEKYK